MTPGEYLRKLREQTGRTLKQVADIYGCSIPYLSDLERGHRRTPRSRIDREALCDAYGAEEADLDACILRTTGAIDLSDLRPKEIERVIGFVAELRAKRDAA